MPTPNEALAAVAGRILNQVQKDAKAVLEQHAADARALIGELRADIATLKADRPKDGKDGRDGKDGVDGADGADGKDGAGGQQGPKGEPGEAGKSVDPETVRIMVRDAFIQAPKPKDGKDGTDGKDGLGFDDLRLEFDGERALKFVFERGTQIKEFAVTIPAMIDRGVFDHKATYTKGDVVSYGGSMWIAKADKTDKTPGDDSGDWRLAVKRGRDGKPGEKGPAGDPGTPADIVLVEGGH
jgi:hypothetical protein